MEVSALGWRSAAQGISRQNCAGLQLPRVLLSPLSHMSPAPKAAMPHKALLFVGFVLMGSLVGSFKFMDNSKFVDIDKNSEFFAISMEYVMYKFNEAQEDEFAYKFLKVRQSQRKMFSWTCLVDVEMGRTICKKHDEDIDNCPLQEGAGEKQVGDHNHSASWENEGSWRRLKTALGQAEESGSLFHTGVRSQ